MKYASLFPCTVCVILALVFCVCCDSDQTSQVTVDGDMDSHDTNTEDEKTDGDTVDGDAVETDEPVDYNLFACEYSIPEIEDTINTGDLSFTSLPVHKGYNSSVQQPLAMDRIGDTLFVAGRYPDKSDTKYRYFIERSLDNGLTWERFPIFYLSADSGVYNYEFEQMANDTIYGFVLIALNDQEFLVPTKEHTLRFSLENYLEIESQCGPARHFVVSDVTDSGCLFRPHTGALQKVSSDYWVGVHFEGELFCISRDQGNSWQKVALPDFELPYEQYFDYCEEFNTDTSIRVNVARFDVLENNQLVVLLAITRYCNKPGGQITRFRLAAGADPSSLRVKTILSESLNPRPSGFGMAVDAEQTSVVLSMINMPPEICKGMCENGVFTASFKTSELLANGPGPAFAVNSDFDRTSPGEALSIYSFIDTLGIHRHLMYHKPADGWCFLEDNHYMSDYSYNVAQVMIYSDRDATFDVIAGGDQTSNSNRYNCHYRQLLATTFADDAEEPGYHLIFPRSKPDQFNPKLGYLRYSPDTGHQWRHVGDISPEPPLNVLSHAKIAAFGPNNIPLLFWQHATTGPDSFMGWQSTALADNDPFLLINSSIRSGMQPAAVFPLPDGRLFFAAKDRIWDEETFAAVVDIDEAQQLSPPRLTPLVADDRAISLFIPTGDGRVVHCFVKPSTMEYYFTIIDDTLQETEARRLSPTDNPVLDNHSMPKVVVHQGRMHIFATEIVGEVRRILYIQRGLDDDSHEEPEVLCSGDSVEDILADEEGIMVVTRNSVTREDMHIMHRSWAAAQWDASIIETCYSGAKIAASPIEGHLVFAWSEVDVERNMIQFKVADIDPQQVTIAPQGELLCEFPYSSELSSNFALHDVRSAPDGSVYILHGYYTRPPWPWVTHVNSKLALWKGEYIPIQQ